MRPGIVRALTLSLSVFAASAAHCEEKSAPDLEIMSASGELHPSELVYLLATRRGSMSHAAVTLMVQYPATIAFAPADGKCKASLPKDSQKIDWQPDKPDSTVICLLAGKETKARVLAWAKGADGVMRTAQSDVIQISNKSIGTDPLVMALLTTTIGFVFGLGSTWFNALTEGYRNQSKARVEAQAFLAKTFFPEIRQHADAIREYQAASNAQRLTLATVSLSEAGATEAETDRVGLLSDYFAALKTKGVQSQLQRYAKLVVRYNDEAAKLSQIAVNSRNLASQDTNVNELSDQLKTLGILGK